MIPTEDWAALAVRSGQFRSIGSSAREQRRTRLLGAEHSVSGIAQAGHDIAVIIQPLVDSRGPDRDVRTLSLKSGNPFERREQADEPDVSGTSRFEQADRGAS